MELKKLTKQRVNYLLSLHTSNFYGNRRRWFTPGEVLVDDGPRRVCWGRFEDNRKEAVDKIGLDLDDNGHTGWAILIETEWQSETVEIKWSDEREKWFQKELESKKKYPTSTRDFQRSKLYRFEQRLNRKRREVPGCDREVALSLEQVTDLYRYIYALLGIDLTRVPSVEISRRKKATSTHYPWLNHIALASGWGQDTKVALHELAHAITGDMERKASDISHGPTFVAVALALYEHFIPGWPDHGFAMNDATSSRLKVSEDDYQTVKQALLGKVGFPSYPKYACDRQVAMQQYMDGRK